MPVPPQPEPGPESTSPDPLRTPAQEDRPIEALAPARVGVDTSSAHVGVRQGVATLTGLVLSPQARDQARDTAAAVPGVRTVPDRLRIEAA